MYPLPWSMWKSKSSQHAVKYEIPDIHIIKIYLIILLICTPGLKGPIFRLLTHSSSVLDALFSSGSYIIKERFPTNTKALSLSSRQAVTNALLVTTSTGQATSIGSLVLVTVLSASAWTYPTNDWLFVTLLSVPNPPSASQYMYFSRNLCR